LEYWLRLSLGYCNTKDNPLQTSGFPIKLQTLLLANILIPRFRTGGFSIEKTYKGHSPEPPTLVVKWMETPSRDVTWLRSDAFLKNHQWPYNLKRNGSKFSEATRLFSIPPYSPGNPPLTAGAGARGDGVAKQMDLGPRWEPGPPPESSAACLQHAALRVVPEQQSIHIPPAHPSSRCESAPCSRVSAMLTLRSGAACAGVYLDSARSRCVQTRRWLPCMCL